MRLHESAEMYLETIYILSLQNPQVRSIDVAEKLGYSKPSVSRAVGLLKQGGYLATDKDGFLALTDSGLAIASKIYQRHTLLSQALISIGVDPAVAAADACRIEHVISDETLNAIQRYLGQ